MMSRIAIVMTLAAMGLVGCGSVTGGTTIVKYVRGQDPGTPIPAPHTGSYALYYTTDATPQVRTRVGQGDKIGFRVSGGTATAVAGEFEKQVPSGVYEAFWKFAGEK